MADNTNEQRSKPEPDAKVGPARVRFVATESSAEYAHGQLEIGGPDRNDDIVLSLDGPDGDVYYIPRATVESLTMELQQRLLKTGSSQTPGRDGR